MIHCTYIPLVYGHFPLSLSIHSIIAYIEHCSSWMSFNNLRIISMHDTPLVLGVDHVHELETVGENSPSVRGEFWAYLVHILVFPSPTG